MSRDRLHVVGLYALLVLQRFRFVDASEQVETSLDWCSGNLCRNDLGFDCSLRLVVYRAGNNDQRPLFEHDVFECR